MEQPPIMTTGTRINSELKQNILELYFDIVDTLKDLPPKNMTEAFIKAVYEELNYKISPSFARTVMKSRVIRDDNDKYIIVRVVEETNKSLYDKQASVVDTMNTISE